MIIQCAWCEKRIGVKYPCDDARIADGICKSCMIKVITKDVELPTVQKLLDILHLAYFRLANGAPTDTEFVLLLLRRTLLQYENHTSLKFTVRDLMEVK